MGSKGGCHAIATSSSTEYLSAAGRRTLVTCVMLHAVDSPQSPAREGSLTLAADFIHAHYGIREYHAEVYILVFRRSTVPSVAQWANFGKKGLALTTRGFVRLGGRRAHRHDVHRATMSTSGNRTKA